MQALFGELPIDTLTKLCPSVAQHNLCFYQDLPDKDCHTKWQILINDVPTHRWGLQENLSWGGSAPPDPPLKSAAVAASEGHQVGTLDPSRLLSQPPQARLERLSQVGCCRSLQGSAGSYHNLALNGHGVWGGAPRIAGGLGGCAPQTPCDSGGSIPRPPAHLDSVMVRPGR